MRLWLGIVALLLTVSCRRTPSSDALKSAADNGTNSRSFQVRGVILSFQPELRQVEVKHEAIPGYMPAMTMPLQVKNTNELQGLEAGDLVSFRMVVTAEDGWIEQVRRLQSVSNAAPNSLPAPPTTGAFRMVRDVQPLMVGDLLPETRLTNELGQPLRTSQYLGRALAITFIFTRCPFPTFCPFTSRNFVEVQQKLSAKPGAPRNWHLLTISFDPQFDRPEVLKGYAQAFNYDSNHWSFATGDLLEITAIADALGCTFWHDETGSITHNLRTAVIDTSGHLRKIFTGNTWTSDDLAAELLAATGKKP